MRLASVRQLPWQSQDLTNKSWRISCQELQRWMDQKSGEIWRSESSLVWIFFARLRKQTGPKNLQGPHKNGWALETRLSGFMFFLHTKKQRKIQQIQRPASSKQVLATLAQTCNSCPRTRYQQVTNVRPVDVGRDA